MRTEGLILIGDNPRHWPFGQGEDRVEYEPRTRGLVSVVRDIQRQRRPGHLFYLVHYKLKERRPCPTSD